jgi:nucleoid-associated protein YgaU
VQPGDNLYNIATRFYGTPSWQKIYNANQGLIGPNPGLIHPGQVLTIPS